MLVSPQFIFLWEVICNEGLFFFYLFLLLTQYSVCFSESSVNCISINLNIANNSQKKLSSFYTTVSTHESHHHTLHNSRPNIHNYSAAQLTQYFEGCPANQILEQRTLFTSDEFVKFAKTVPGYEDVIISLYRNIHKKGWLGKLAGICVGSYSSGLQKRIKSLYQELQAQKQADQAAKQRQIEDAYKQKLEIITQQSSHSRVRVQALEATRRDPSHRTTRSFAVDKAIAACTEQYGITQKDLTTGSMNAYEY